MSLRAVTNAARDATEALRQMAMSAVAVPPPRREMAIPSPLVAAPPSRREIAVPVAVPQLRRTANLDDELADLVKRNALSKTTAAMRDKGLLR